ncbi:S8 family serine peptidase [bacterium]|nr:S8 family serine peptidase [bacterium]
MAMRVTRTGMLLTVLAVLALLAPLAQANVDPNSAKAEPILMQGTLVIEFESDANIQQVQQGFGFVSVGLASVDQLFEKHQISAAAKVFPWRQASLATSLEEKRLTRMYQLTLPETADLDAVRDDLLQNPRISDVHILYAMPVTATPDDPEFTSQWHRIELELESAWEYEKGSDNVVIAILDTGVNYNHPDLKANIWVNPGEDIDGDGIVWDDDDFNGVDDDGNGFVDDVIGWDFFSGGFTVMTGEDPGPPDKDPNDFDGHGTHCAGISAAVTNNTTDVIGLAGGWAGAHRSHRGSRIMVCRIGGTASDGNGYVNPVNAAQAIDYARLMGADIINMSWGGSSTQSTAIALAASAGLTLLHAAGNDNCDCPDALDGFGTNVLSIASTTDNDTKSSFSNYGAWVDVSAPGSGILSTVSNAYTPDIDTYSGTSMASPMVAGLAALIRSAMPTLTKAQVDSVIMATTDDIDAINPSYAGELGTGRINAFNALSTMANAQFTSTETDGPVPLTIDFTDLSPNSPTTWDWDFGDGGFSSDQNPQHTYTAPGLYTVTLEVTDANGVGTERLNRYVWAQADTVKADSVEAIPGTTVPVTISLTNSIPVTSIEYSFRIPNDDGVVFASPDLTGTRCEGMTAQIQGYDVANDRYSVIITVSDPGDTDWLPAGSGPVMTLNFNVPGNYAESTPIVIDTTTFGSRNNELISPIGAFVPTFEPGYLYLAGCCIGSTGNVNGDGGGAVDLSDLIYLVNYLFLGGPAPACVGAANVNGDLGCAIDLSDLIYLVNYLFLGGPAPAACIPACG